MATSAVMMETSHDATAAERQILLVGASRGLGLALTKLFAANHWKVVATERRSGATSELKAAAAAADGRIRIERVDINDLEQVHGLHQQLSGKLFDVIFIVAGVNDDPTKPVHQVPVREFTRVFVSNAFSPIYFAETFFDCLKPKGTLAIMSSRMGSVTLAPTYSAGDGWETYRASKAALNMLTRCFRQRHCDDGSTLLLVHPGWVKTDMGGENAPVELATSVQGLYDVLQKWQGSGDEAYLDYEGNVLPW
jgi:NAD(P)-dependent dehydrogenase (short-subunit alcohol dehydrogenase family)